MTVDSKERTTATTQVCLSGATTTGRQSNRSGRTSPLPAKKLTSLTVVEVDDEVFIRCYSGKNFVDAVVTVGCLANLVADGARVLRSKIQKQ